MLAMTTRVTHGTYCAVSITTVEVCPSIAGVALRGLAPTAN